MRAAIVLSGLTIVLISGIVSGMWSERWMQQSMPLNKGQLARLPLQLQGWAAQENSMSEREKAQAQIEDYTIRQYVNQRDGKSLIVMIVGGRPGPVSVHTPDVCFPGAGFRQISPKVLREFAAPHGRPSYPFWSADFQKSTGSHVATIRVLWTWYASQGWQAPGEARLAFAREPVLYKLYIVQELPDAADSNRDTGLDSFIPLFLADTEGRLPGTAPGL